MKKWVKIPVDFFDSLYARKLKDLPDGYIYLTLYAQMIIASAENGYVLEHEGVEEDIVSEIALLLGEHRDTVQETLDLLVAWSRAEFTDTGGLRFVNPLLDYERTGNAMSNAEKQKAYRERKKAAEAEAETVTENVSETQDLVSQLKEKFESPQDVDNSVEKADKEADIKKLFDRFWAAYPGKKDFPGMGNRKADKEKCFKAFKELKPDEEFTERVVKALAVMKRDQSWTKQNGTYIPAPLVFLHRKDWEAVDVNDVPTDGGSFETDDFFNAAVKRSYGDDYEALFGGETIQ